MVRKSKKKKQRTVTSGAARGASALGVSATASQRTALGSDEMRAGMEQFLEEVHRRANLGPKQAKGFLLERILAAKFNTNAGNLGDTRRAHVRGDNHPVIDIEITKGRKVVDEVQVKDGKNLAKRFDDPRYEDVTKSTTKDNADPQRGIQDGLSHGDVRASVTQSELQRATKGPKAYAGFQEFKQVGGEAAVAGGAGAVSGAILGGATSAVRNFWAWGQGEKDGKEAVKEVANDTIRSSARGGAAAAGSSVVRHVGHKAGVEVLKKANIAAAVASGLMDVSATVWSLAKGEISAEEAAIRLGDTGCGALSGIYGGAAAGAIFGPVGAAAGSVVGYLLSACVYQSCVATFQKARLAEEEAERVVALCAEAVRRMDEQRRQFERDAGAWLDVRQSTFDRHFKEIDTALAGGDPRKSTKSLSRFALSFGKKLRHAEFEDFRRFMDSKEPLVL